MLIQVWFECALYILLCAFSIAGWARVIKKIEVHFFNNTGFLHVQRLGLGLSFWATLSFFIGMVPGGFSKAPQLFLLFTGVALFFFRRREDFYKFSTFRKLLKPEIKSFVWMIFPILFILVRTMTAGVPDHHTDPLYYHLAAAKDWFLQHQIRLDESHPSFVQATLIESLFSIPLFFKANVNLNNLVLTEIFSQQFHHWFGYVFSIFVIWRIFQQSYPQFQQRDRFFWFFLSFILATLPAHQWLGGLAKNDFFLFSFVLLSLLSLIRSQFLSAGWFLGFAFAVKPFAIWTIFAAYIFVPFSSWITFSVLIFSGCFSVLFRNFIWYKNPFFPALDGVFSKNYLHSLWKQHNASFAGFHVPDSDMLFWFWTKLLDKPISKILFVLALFGVVYGFKPKYKKWIFFCLTQFVFLIFFLKPGADGRYGNASLVTFIILGILCLYEAKLYLKKRWSYLLLCFGLMITIPIEQVVKISKNLLFESAEKNLTIYDTNWPIIDYFEKVSANLSDQEKKSRIVLAPFDKTFYFLPLPYITASEQAKFEKLVDNSITYEVFKNELLNQNVKFVLISKRVNGITIFKHLWEPILKEAKEHHSFEFEGGYVLELQTPPQEG